MQKIFVILFLLFLPQSISAKTRFPESDYQNIWCSLHNGISEYKNTDKTRVDCLTKTHAVEFDFAKKWAESVGQAEYYALMTGKRGMVVLIIENPEEIKYLKKVQALSKLHDLDVDYVTPKILFLKDKN